MKKLKLSDSVQYLDIVCYAEQFIFFDGEDEAKAWEDIKTKKIKCIRKDDLVVFCIAQKEDDGKIHYHFAVFVAKRKGEAHKQRVSYVLNALGIRFREEDRELFEHNVQRMDIKNGFDQILYMLHMSKSADGKRKYNIADVCSNLSDEELTTYCLNGGNAYQNQKKECEKVILARLQSTASMGLDVLRYRGQYNTTMSDFAGYEYLTAESKQAFFDVLLDKKYNNTITMFDFGDFGTIDVTLEELLDPYMYDMQDYIYQLMQYDVLVNQQEDSAVLINGDYDFITLTGHAFYDLSLMIADKKNTNEEKENIVETLVEQQISMTFGFAKDMQMLHTDKPILSYKGDYTTVDVRYIDDESKQALFDCAFSAKRQNTKVDDDMTIADLMELIPDMREFASHYNIIAGRAIYQNKKEYIYLIEKDNGTYIDITKNATFTYNMWLNRYAEQVRFADFLGEAISKMTKDPEPESGLNNSTWDKYCSAYVDNYDDDYFV